MTYEQLINEINEKINTNGAGKITGAVLNDVLRDIVATLKNDADTVHVFISNQDDAATFVWPFEDTAINDVVIEGYDGKNFNDINKFPKPLMRIGDTNNYSVYYEGHGFSGSLSKLIKGNWYFIQYSSVNAVNCSIYLKRPNQ